jgi:hypothetical protein
MHVVKTVPFEVFELVQTQLGQALQMIAALTLNDDEVISCIGKNYDNKAHLLGWASFMKEDLLNEDGREQLLDMLSRHQFPSNSHSGFIYGAFESPPITYEFLQGVDHFVNMVNEYELDQGEDFEDPNNLKSYFRNKLYENKVSKENVDFILEIIGTRIFIAAFNRRMKQAK